MDINEIIMKRLLNEVLENFDTTSLKKEVEKSIIKYFKSESFAEQIAECLYEEGIGYEVTNAVKPKILAAVRKIKFTAELN